MVIVRPAHDMAAAAVERSLVWALFNLLQLESFSNGFLETDRVHFSELCMRKTINLKCSSLGLGRFAAIEGAPQAPARARPPAMSLQA